MGRETATRPDVNHRAITQVTIMQGFRKDLR